MSKRLERLKEQERTLKEKIRQEQARLREVERKRRTRALIILGSVWVEMVASGKWPENVLMVARGKLVVKEKGKTLDLLPYIEDEIQRLRRSRALQGDALDDDFGIYSGGGS
jgi:hypothetical protein